MMLTVNKAAGEIQDHHHQSLVTLQQGHCTLLSLIIVLWTMHDAIHTVREQPTSFSVMHRSKGIQLQTLPIQ